MNASPTKKTARWFQSTTWKKIAANKALYFMFLPVLLNFVIFHYLPMIGIQIAFRDYHPAYPLSAAPWIGLDKFKAFFNSYYSWDYIRNTIVISFSSIIVQFPLPILLALLINEIRSNRFKRTVQTITYMPNFISSVIMVAIITMILSPNDGIVNRAITALGGTTIHFMEGPQYFVPIYLSMGVWAGTGFGAIVYLAAIAGIDAELYEAAVIDGAGRFSRMWHITFKSIVPTIAIMFIMRLGGILSVGWTEILLMQNSMNISVSEVIQTFVYKRGIVGADYSYGAAVDLMMSILGMGTVILSNFVVRKLTDSEISLF